MSHKDRHVPLRESAEVKYEGRDKKRWGGEVRSDEARKWDEGPRGEVEGTGVPHCRDFNKNQTKRTLKISLGLRLPDGWVMNRKMKRIILLEFKEPQTDHRPTEFKEPQTDHRPTVVHPTPGIFLHSFYFSVVIKS